MRIPVATSARASMRGYKWGVRPHSELHGQQALMGSASVANALPTLTVA